MEPLRRLLMLLKPGDGFVLPPGKNGGMLKIQSADGGLVISLSADCLGEGDYFLYLFTNDAKELYAGDIRNGSLRAELARVSLESVIGAAVVLRDGDTFTFCLRSAGPDWQALIKRFCAARSAPKEMQKVDAAPKILTLKQEPDVTTEPPYVEAESKYFGIPKTLYKEVMPEEPTVPEQPAIPEEYISELERQKALEHLTKPEGFMGAPFERAEPGFEEDGCDDCPQAQKEENINPFPSVFPNSEWVKISYPGPAGWWHYISGRIYKGGALVAKALGVPGEYGMAPPIWLEGFGTYLRCIAADARGYWLMFQDAETGEVLDMGLSPHGA